MAPTSTPQNDRSSKLLFTTPPGRRRGDYICEFSHGSPLGLTAPVQMPSSLYLPTHTWGLDSNPVNFMYVTFSPPPSRYECLKLLANVGADIDALDFNGHTALYRTLKVVGDSVQLNLKGAKFLVAKDVNLQGKGEFSIRGNSNHVSDNFLYPWTPLSAKPLHNRFTFRIICKFSQTFFQGIWWKWVASWRCDRFPMRHLRRFANLSSSFWIMVSGSMTGPSMTIRCCGEIPLYIVTIKLYRVMTGLVVLTFLFFSTSLWRKLPK